MIKILITIIVALIIKQNYKKGRFISSSTIYLGCYFLIFVLFPICQTDEVYKNAHIIDIYALMGLISFWFGLKTVKDNSKKLIKYNYIRTIQFKKVKYIYFIVLAISTFLFIKQVGMSLIELILVGAMSGKELNLGEDIATKSYGYFTDLMIPLVMVMCVSANNKKERILSYIAVALYVAFTIFFDFTRIFTITILAMVVIYKIRYLPQSKQLFYASIGVTSLFFLLVSMNFVRCMGIGVGLNFEQIFDIGYIFESSDFGASYAWFDRLLNIEPPYIRIDTYLKPVLYLFIPRSIWIDKPEQTSMQILKILDPSLASTGYSAAGFSVLGEGYAMIGYIGIVVFPYIWGVICSKMDIKYYRRLRSGFDNCTQNLYYYYYAVFVVLCGQRGDWNQYLILVIWFYMLPIHVMSKKQYPCFNKSIQDGVHT